MYVPYLFSNTLHLVDVEITDDQINAGWVYTDGGLSAVETLTDGEFTFDIRIHPKVQAIKNQTEFFLANDVIEFMRCQN
ncbi:MAG: hypothetical protein F6K11_18120 [Leptolyngbya sp. SIO3F4]|nr:hypothetical protein [Leptolyngbya sp. SIO3F4]